MEGDEDANEEKETQPMSSVAFNHQPTLNTPAVSQSVWRQWLEEYISRLTFFARQQTRSFADAEDVLQNALVKLSKKVTEGTFIGEQESWMPFMYTQLRREAIDLGRKNDRRRKREEYSHQNELIQKGDHEKPWFEQNEDQDDFKALIESKLKELSPKFSEVIVMKIWGEQTFAKIGEALNISQNTAASRYRYGIEALRKKLAGIELDGESTH